MARATTFAQLVNDQLNHDQSPLQLSVVDGDGNPVSIGGTSTYTLPAATASAIGGVKQLNGMSDLASTAALSDVINQVNTLVAGLKATGIMSS